MVMREADGYCTAYLIVYDRADVTFDHETDFESLPDPIKTSMGVIISDNESIKANSALTSKLHIETLMKLMKCAILSGTPDILEQVCVETAPRCLNAAIEHQTNQCCSCKSMTLQKSHTVLQSSYICVPIFEEISLNNFTCFVHSLVLVLLSSILV